MVNAANYYLKQIGSFGHDGSLSSHCIEFKGQLRELI